MRQPESNPGKDHGEKAGFERWNIAKKPAEFDASGIEWDTQPQETIHSTDALAERNKEDIDPIEFILELSAYASLDRYSIQVLTDTNKNRRIQDLEPGEHVRTLTIVDESTSDKSKVVAFADATQPGYYEPVVGTINHMITKGYKPWIAEDIKRYIEERPVHRPITEH